MRKFKINKISEAGSLMVEAIAMLGLISMVTPVVYKKSAERMNELEDINVASQMRTISAAVDAYLADNYDDLSKSEGGTIKINKLVNYLPKGMVVEGKEGKDASLYGVLGDDYQVSYVKNTPEDGQPTLTGYVAANNVNGIVDAKRASRIATMIGGNGGVIDGGTAYGAQGVWQTGLADIGLNKEGGYAENSIVVSSSSTVGAGGISDTSEFLHRNPQDNKELNTMRTTLYMYDGTNANNIMGVGRLLIGAQEGGTDDLNADDIQGENYSLYVRTAGGSLTGGAYIQGSLEAIESKFKVENESLTFNPYAAAGTNARNTKGSFVVDSTGLQYNDPNSINGSTAGVFNISAGKMSYIPAYDDTKFEFDLNERRMSSKFEGIGEIELSNANGVNISTVADSGKKIAINSGDVLNIDVKKDMTTNVGTATVPANMNTTVTGNMTTTVGRDNSAGNIKFISKGRGTIELEGKYSENKSNTITIDSKADTSKDSSGYGLAGGVTTKVQKGSIRNITEANADVSSGVYSVVKDGSQERAVIGVEDDKSVSNTKRGRIYTETYEKDGSSNRIRTSTEMGTKWAGEGYINLATYSGDPKKHNGKYQPATDIELTEYNVSLSKYDLGKTGCKNCSRADARLDVGVIEDSNGNNVDGVVMATYFENGSGTRDAGAGVAVEGKNVSAFATKDINVESVNGEIVIGRNDGSPLTDRLSTNGGNGSLQDTAGGLIIRKDKNVELKGGKTLYLNASSRGKSPTKDRKNDGLILMQDGILAVDSRTSTGSASLSYKTSDGTSYNKAPSVYIRRGAIDVATDTDPSHWAPNFRPGMWGANQGTGYIAAERFVVYNSSDSGAVEGVTPQYYSALDQKGYRHVSNTGGTATLVKYDHYMVDPAYTSVMHDIKLTSRGGARLSDILPDFINKGIYVVDNSYDEGAISECFNIYGDQSNESKCNTSDSDYASAYLGAIPAPQCPPGYAKVITLQPSGWTMGQVGTLVIDNSSKSKNNGRAYIQPIDNYSKIKASMDKDDENNPTGAVTNYGSVISDYEGNAEPVTKAHLYSLASQIDRLVQSSTYMKSAIKPKTSTDKLSDAQSSKLAGANNNQVVGWDTYIGFIYPASYWKASLDDLGFKNVNMGKKEQDNSFNSGVYWNLFPVDKYSIEGYATVYCYFDRNGLLQGDTGDGSKSVFNPSFVDTTYNQFDLNAHRSPAAGSTKVKNNQDYVRRLFNPKLRYNDEW